MNLEINPFHELYVTETAGPEEFVRLFSPFLIKHANLLFQPGNVVLKGTQGTGKSMLLNLLRPEIRRAYYATGVKYPIPHASGTFVGAGINLTRSGAIDIGQRPISQNEEEDERLFPLYFGDFINYWIVSDILATIEYMGQQPEIFAGIARPDTLSGFARALARDDCWFGYLEGVESFSDLNNRLRERISLYRSFHQDNIRSLPESISHTKTRIGEPISTAAECLWAERVIPAQVPVYIRIDQYEILMDSDDLRPSLGLEYRRVINKALGARDPRISYRIGTRSYAWQDDINVFGTTLTLEHERDFKIVDLDDILRRKEDRSTYIFPRFADDIFNRRLRYAGFRVPEKALRKVMGRSTRPSEAATYYVGTTDAKRALKIERSWPKHWADYLVALFNKDPLSAKLAEAWLRQRGSDPTGSDRLKGRPPKARPLPWEKTYWKKERHRQALMQLAARCAQRLVWSGEENIIALSTGSTLVFVSMCQHIWDAFLRSQRAKPSGKYSNPMKDGINDRIQAIGIQTASTHWYVKINEKPDGSDRKRFIDIVGRRFYTGLVNDAAMSYPGHNGFSVRIDELETNEDVNNFLRKAVDYGDLFDASHTTKEKSAQQRKKYYLNPILSPHFRIPESHVKEPIYLKVSQVRLWMREAGILSIEDNSQLQKTTKKTTLTDERQLKLY
ncbi:hypothetical protein BH18ACI4_BH18ACI4_00790 [soil metagenome]